MKQGPTKQAQPRPPQVTYAGWAVILGSIALVVSAFHQVSTLHTLDTRNSVAQLLRDEPSGLGFTVDGWLTALKVLSMICGACAAAAAILGWQTLQRSGPARIVLLVLAVPLVLSGLATGPFFAAIIVVAVVTLWLPVANAWFGRPEGGNMQGMSEAPPPPGPPPGPPTGPSDPEGQQPGRPAPYGQPYGQPSSGQAPQYGAPQAPQYGAPQAPYATPQQMSPYAPYSSMPGPDVRPGGVTAAAVITFVLAGLAAVFGLLLMIGAAAADDFYRTLSDQGYDLHGVTQDELRAGLLAGGAIVTVLSVAAIVAAIFVMRRSRPARVILTVLAGITILCSLAGITSAVTVVPLAGAIATIVLLFQRRSNDWFARRSGFRPPPYPGAPGGPWQG